MGVKFNIGRPKLSDEEIGKGKDFQQLVRRFREQSLKKARGDESWRKNKMIRYTAVIAGITVVCTVTYQAIRYSQNKQKDKHDKISTTASTHTTSKSKPRPAVAPPASKLKTGYATYRVDNARGGTVAHGGSRISVPKGAFVNRQGEEIVGEVTLEYREFHDAGDVLMNGVPMAYDSAGHAFQLETAGMFDIRGHQSGEPVFIGPDRTLEVRLASRTAEDRFNQYYLDTVTGNWNYLKRDAPIVQSDRVRKRSVPAPVVAATPVSNRVTKRVDSVGAVYQRQIAKLPALRKPVLPPKPTAGRPTFVLEGSYDEFPELAAFDNVIFEVGPENRNYDKSLHEITWSDIRITPGPDKERNYLLSLSYRNRREQLIVYPVIAEKNYESARRKHEARLQEYERLAEKRAADERRLVAEMEAKQKAFMEAQKRQEREAAAAEVQRARREQAELVAAMDNMSESQRALRVFQVSRFGIYNSDCPHPRPGGPVAKAEFIVHGTAKQLHPDRIFLVDHSNRTVYEYGGNEKIASVDGNGFSLCVVRNEKIYTCNREHFASTRDKESQRFEVKALPDSEMTPAALKKALDLPQF